MDSLSISYPNRQALLDNKVDSVAITGGIGVLGTRKTYYYAYVQDDIKVRSNLTVNLGLRYEYYGVNKEVHDRYRVFDLNECKGFCPHGTPWYFPDRNNFDPRVGIAWAPKALKGRTVIRTGGGIYHGPGQVDDVNTPLDNYITNYSLTRNEAPNLAYPITPFLGMAKEVGITPRSMQRDRSDLYSANWGLSIQQQLPAGFITQVAYSASIGKKLFATSCAQCHPNQVKATSDNAHAKVAQAGNPNTPTCADCHNPHATTAKPAIPPAVSGALQGVTGVASGTPVAEAKSSCGT